jgi:hypothetical protein
VAPLLADQLKVTCPLPLAADKPMGTVGIEGAAAGAAGTALTCAEFGLSPAESRAETT